MSIGIATLNTIGLVVFILGSIVFIMEMVGYRPHVYPPFVTKSTTRWDALSLVQVAIVAALFGGGLAVTAGLVLVPGIAYIRVAQAVTPVFGILFGVPGALGSALGNFIGDIFAGTLTLGSAAGFVGNFLSAYVPYRIVYAARRADLSSLRDLILYIVGVVAGTFAIAFYIPFWLALLNIIPDEVAWTAVFGVIWANGLPPLILGPILLKLLYPYVRRWNMFWADHERAPEHLRSSAANTETQIT